MCMNEVGNVRNLKLAIIFLLLVLFIDNVFASNATVVYKSNTGTCAVKAVNCPKIREWNSAGAGSWGPEIGLETAGSEVGYAIVKYSPVSQKRVIVTQGDDGFIDAYVSFDGVTWEVSNNIGRVWTSSPPVSSRRFNVDFETTTGNVIVVYGIESTNTSCDLAYRVLLANESNFSSTVAQCIDDAGHATDIQYGWIRMKRKPTSGSNELTLVAFDITSNHMTAFVWNGSAWGNQIDISTAAGSTGGLEALAVTYTTDGSQGVVATGDGTTGNVATYYWGGAAWVNSPDFFELGSSSAPDIQWLNLKADPASNKCLQAVFIDSAKNLGTAYWNGSAWVVTPQVDSAVDSASVRVADVAWDPTGSTGKLVWDTDTAGTTLSVISCAPLCNSSITTISTYTAAGNFITMYTNPNATDNVKTLGLRLNGLKNIGSFTWNSTNFTNYGDSALTSDLLTLGTEAYSLDFQRAWDTKAPSYTNQSQSNNTITQADTNYLTVVWTDNVRLKTAKLETNETGVWENKTVYGSPISLSGTYALVNFSWYNSSAAPGTVVGWRVWASDAAGNWNVTGYMSFTVTAADLVPPWYANQSQSSDSVAQGETNYLTVDWYDNMNLSKAVLEINETGTFRNVTGAYGSPYNMSGNYTRVNFTWSNASITPGTVVTWRVWANDTTGNWNVTGYKSFSIIGNATIAVDRTEAEACGTVYYKVETFDVYNAPIDAPVSIGIWNTSGATWYNTSATTVNGTFKDAWAVPSNVDYGTWSIRGTAGSVLGEATFTMGLGISTLPQNIEIVFYLDKLLYNLNENIQMNFTPFNQIGEKMTGLLPDRILIRYDATNITANVTEYGGTYVYWHTSKDGGSHVVTATVGNITNSKAFSVKWG